MLSSTVLIVCISAPCSFSHAQGLCKWSSENFGLTLPPAAADGRDIVGALRSGVAAVAAEAAPKCIVFVEDDWQVGLLIACQLHSQLQHECQ